MPMTRSMLIWIALSLLALACGDDGRGPDAPPAPDADTSDAAERDTADAAGGPVFDPERSTYHLAIVAPSGKGYTLDRDITGAATAFSFGSTHIAPAVSLAVSETVTWTEEGQATLIIAFDFGKVVGSTEHPIHTDAPGVYPFSIDPPGLKVQVEGLEFTSFEAAAEGQIEILEYGDETGERMAGVLGGTLAHPNGFEITVTGDFHFILPEKASGQ